MSTPGQFAWFEAGTGQRRDPTLADARAAITLGDALLNVTVVGAMAVPLDIPTPIRDVVTTAALVRGTGKPTRTWPVSRASTQHVLAIYEAVAGGTAALRERPMVETFLEPISPLRFPETGLDVMIPFIERGQPVSVGPMVMASGTGPATLAGTLAQENAEILAGIAIVQAFAPGHAMMYGGIPHVMDPRTSTCSFGSPEQGLMALAMAQVGQAYGFPVYVNSNLTDAKRLDAQAGIEKAASLVMSVIGGADQLGHAGIVGADHGAGLDWLVVDDEALGFAKRIARGFEVDDDTLAYDVIAAVGSSGDFLAEEHTVRTSAASCSCRAPAGRESRTTRGTPAAPSTWETAPGPASTRSSRATRRRRSTRSSTGSSTGSSPPRVACSTPEAPAALPALRRFAGPLAPRPMASRAARPDPTLGPGPLDPARPVRYPAGRSWTDWNPKRPLMHRWPSVIDASIGDVTLTTESSCTCRVSVQPTPQYGQIVSVVAWADSSQVPAARMSCSERNISAPVGQTPMQLPQ